MNADRNVDFKRGVGDGSYVREERNEASASIRKQKRGEKLAQRRRGIRNINRASGAAAAAARSRLSEFNFDKNGLLQTQNGPLCATALSGLANFLRNQGTDEEMDEMLTNNFDALFYNNNAASGPVLDGSYPIVLGRLVALCDFNDPSMRDVVQNALDCLVNVTGSVISPVQALKAAHVILSSGFLDIVVKHVNAFHANTNLMLTPGMLKDFWSVVGNVCMPCTETRDVVINSSLIRFDEPNQSGGWRSPFVRELDRLCSDDTDTQERLSLMPSLLHVVCGLVEGGVHLPPWQFIKDVWPYLLKIMHNMRRGPEKAMKLTTPELWRTLWARYGNWSSRITGSRCPT